jgi:rRNA maturation RNase YbeY
MAIIFFEEDIKFTLQEKNKHKKWLREIAANGGFAIEELNYIFCSDEYLLQINQQYLNHNTYTDIITFDNSESDKKIISDIFISIDRVKDNATKEKTAFENELLRVMSHGLLHLMGYKDKNHEDKKTMRDLEDQSIRLFNK